MAGIHFQGLQQVCRLVCGCPRQTEIPVPKRSPHVLPGCCELGYPLIHSRQDAIGRGTHVATGRTA
jgi:hypothetical protein